MEIILPSLRSIQRRQRLWAVLQHGRGSVGRAFNLCIAILIIISVAIIPLEWVNDFQKYSATIHIFEAVIVGVFTIEYILRIYSAPRRLKYIFSFWGVIDLAAILPFYVGIFGSEYIRALRLLRLFKLGGVEPSGRSDEGQSLEDGIGLLPDETIEHIANKHPLVLFIGGIPSIIAITAAFSAFLGTDGDPIGIAIGVTLLLFAFVFFWRTWLDYSYDVIYITNMRLIFQDQHLLGRSVNQVGYGAITNVKPQYAGIFSYVFGYGTLVIDTAAENPGQISMRIVQRHEQAAHEIMRQMSAHGHVGSIELS